MWKFSHWKNKNATLCCFATALCKCFIFCFCFADFFFLSSVCWVVFLLLLLLVVFLCSFHLRTARSFVFTLTLLHFSFHCFPCACSRAPISIAGVSLGGVFSFTVWQQPTVCRYIFINILLFCSSNLGICSNHGVAMRTKLSTENIVDSNIGTANNTIDISSRSRSSSGNNNKNDRHASSSSSSNRDWMCSQS